MKRDAELHADDDKRKREFAEAKVEGENRAYHAERTLRDLGDKVSENDKAPSTPRSKRSGRL